MVCVVCLTERVQCSDERDAESAHVVKAEVC